MLAPAKLNLYLHVIGRRADGYHLLDSLVAFADIGDWLTVAPAQRLSVAVTGPFAKDLASIDPAQNLVWRAAERLARQLGRVPDAAITLEKRLPVASGIGGGSSDAAVALKSLVSLWRAPLSDGTLAALGAELGADVPVCLAGRSAFVGGVGESIEPAPALPPVAVVLANPGRALVTADVFRTRAGPFGKPTRFARAPQDAADLARLLADRRNDLTDAARAIVPEIDDVLAALAGCSGALLARMSGSGATCFALFADIKAAQDAAARLRSANRGWWMASGRLLP